jgi:phage-related minor tail protein
MQSSLNQGMQTYNNAVQANRDVDAQLRRQKADREREASEQQRQRNEDAANQRRQAEENRRQRDEAQRAERVRVAQLEEDRRQTIENAEREKQAKLEAEKERKRKENSGKWVDGAYHVTTWGCDKLFKETYLSAFVTNSTGDVSFHGQYLNISNGSPKYSAQYATTISRGTLAPGEKKLIHIPFDNGPDNIRNTEYNITVRYFVPE